jgi:hypothetical protein
MVQIFEQRDAKVEKIISCGEIDAVDRYYQCHKNFRQWIRDNKYFICRIKISTEKIVCRMTQVHPNSIVFYDSVVLLCAPGITQTEEKVRAVGYQVDGNGLSFRYGGVPFPSSI